MDKILKHLNGDRVIWVIAMLMMMLSLVTVYSFVPILVKVEGGTPFKYLFKHLVYIGISLGVMYWVHRKDPKYFSQLSKFGFYLAVALMIFTFFFGVTVNTASRWVRIPFVGLTFQSSDFARLALVIYISRLLVKKKDKLNDWKEGFLPVVVPIIVICGLIMKDNFSTAAILFGVSLVILFLGKVPFSKVATMIVGGILMLSTLISIQELAPESNVLPRWETWKNRIFNHVDDEQSVQDNAQVSNSKDAIFNGRPKFENGFGFIGGKGVGNGQLKGYLPEAYADFFYASFVEEFGPIWAGVLILLYLILLYRIMRIGLNSKKMFETYVCIGIGVLMLSQATVNMLVCTGVFPVTGQNMPLLAMGGSAMIMTCLGLGIVQSIASSQNVEEKKKGDMILESV
ncbi:MAG: FtsW/RodA/SpoVE family cell cycle protein [Crocinitomicaceae bacterium]|nr:FtsW/RodA/SpoVE family cell cycle protein [Crocinitomicaceae bacterium]